MLLVKLNIPLIRLYLCAYLSVKFTIFAIDGGTMMVFDYLYRVVRSFYDATWICLTKWYAHCVYHCKG